MHARLEGRNKNWIRWGHHVEWAGIVVLLSYHYKNTALNFEKFLYICKWLPWTIVMPNHYNDNALTFEPCSCAYLGVAGAKIKVLGELQ